MPAGGRKTTSERLPERRQALRQEMRRPTSTVNIFAPLQPRNAPLALPTPTSRQRGLRRMARCALLRSQAFTIACGLPAGPVPYPMTSPVHHEAPLSAYPQRRARDAGDSPLKEEWEKNPLRIISLECARAARHSDVRTYSGRRPCCVLA